MDSSRQYAFGEFSLDRGQRALFRRGELIPLTPKSVETLLFLVERHGRIVDKKELMDAVWPDTFVEEVSLARNVSVLRKILSENEEGQSYIETIPKRGYRFVASVTENLTDHALPAAAPSSGMVPERATQATPAAASVPSRRARQWLAAAGIVLASAAALAYWLLASRPALSFANRDWILIADFENQTGDPRFDKALLTALTVSLEQSRYANIFPRSRLPETMQRMRKPQAPGQTLAIDDSLGREICLRENLRALFEAGLTRAGKEYLLTGRLVDPKTGLAARSYSSKVTDEDQILDALDRMAQNVRRDLGETLFSVRRDTRALPQVTTASLSALQLYAQGSDLWSKGAYQDANKQLLEAIRIDPDFAMAHAALGNQYYSHIFTKPIEGKAEYERALRLSSRITERERLFIEASFAGQQKAHDDAIRLYRVYLQAYPDDIGARFNLANVLLRLSRCGEAIAQFRELLRINPADANSEINMATCYVHELKYAEALPHYSRAFELQPDRITSSNINREYGFALVGAGQPEKAREVFALGLAKKELRRDALRSLGLLDLYEGRYKDAVTQFTEAVKAAEAEKNDLSVARNRLYLAVAYAGQGAPAAAISQLDQASKLDSVLSQATWVVARIGSAYVRFGNPDGGARVLAKLRAKLKPDDSEGSSEATRLEGEILVARGDTDQGVALLQQSQVESYASSIALGLEAEARARAKASQPEKAIALYESFLCCIPINPLAWEVQQPWLEAHYLLAQLHASQGNPVRATQLLDTLLSVWKNADPDLPLYQEAKLLRDRLNH